MPSGDSLIGGGPVTIEQAEVVVDSLIGGGPVTIDESLGFGRRVGGAWVAGAAFRRRRGGAWVGSGEPIQVSPHSDSLIGGGPVTIDEARPTEGSTDPHTGVPVVWWETLTQPGDQVWQALNRAASPCVVSFPAGTFAVTDFAARTISGVATGAGINLEKGLIHGIVGVGPATRFELTVGSSTKGGTNLTPSQAQGGTTQVMIIRSVDHAGPLALRNFAVVGTAQGHNFHGILAENVAGDILIEGVTVSGWCGDNGAPPGETSGLAVKPNSAAQLTIRRVTCDGRYPDGTVAGTVGIHVMHAIGALVEDCHTINHRISAAMVNYHTVNTTWRRCRMGSDVSVSGWPFNAECNTGTLIEECIFGQPSKLLHATWSNTTHSRTFNGVNYSLANGTLLVKGGKWGPSGIGGAGSMLAIQSWTSGIDGSATDTQTTPPQVVNAAGIGQTYRWVHGDHQNITSSNL